LMRYSVTFSVGAIDQMLREIYHSKSRLDFQDGSLVL
jgi:hypothetical protein